ncbi:MAG TPA: DUF3488 and transglutaminase-like domain-containing protein [Phycisphaerae bacterium]|nr:DUF3488 and transglutaminase-like domain-containing protein [Phycisphaerae bacterium]
MAQLAPAPPPTTPPFLQPFPRLVLLIHATAILALAAFALAEQNAAIFIGGLAASIIAWLLVDQRQGANISRIVINLAVLAAAVDFFYRAFTGDNEDMLVNLGHFMIFILLAKLFERKKPRDVAQIFGLSLLIVVTGGIFATSAAFATLVALYILVALYALLLLPIHIDTLAAWRDRLLPPAAFSHARRLRLYRDLRVPAFFSTFILLLVGFAVFLLAPRGNGQAFMSPWTPSATFETGYSSTVRLYGDQTLVQSDAIVMQVRIEQNGVSLGSETFQPYFRGITCDSYNPVLHQWTRSPALDDLRRFVARHDGAIPLGPAPSEDPASLITQTYSLQIMRDNVLFSMDDPVAITSDQLSSASYSPRDFSILTAVNHRTPIQYAVTSVAIPRTPQEIARQFPDPSHSQDPDSPFVTPGSLGSYRRNFNAVIPSVVPPEIMTEARRILAAHKIDLPPDGQHFAPNQVRNIADIFQNYLQANYPYTLSFTAVNPDLDPTADFLLNRKTIGGHCELFASAMVMLCRAVGINARIVTGFHGGDYNNLGGFYIVRELDAHAWTEVFLPNKGWTRYDPSPDFQNTAAAADGFARWFREFSQIIQQSWLSNIVSFDRSSQASVLQSLLASLRHLIASLRDTIAYSYHGLVDVSVGGKDISRSARWLTLLGALCAAALAFWVLRHIWRRRTNPLPPTLLRNLDRRLQRRLSHELLFFEEFLRLLRKAGVPRQPGQTPREYIDTLQPQLAAAHADAHYLVSTFYGLRFGYLDLTPPIRTRIAAALQAVRSSLR